MSCSYSVYPSGYPHLKTISIATFENNSVIYNLDEDLFIYLSSAFIQDGRLKIVSISPDCLLEGKIIDYSNDIYKFSNIDVEEYEVKILFSVSFTDLTRNSLILSRENFVLSETYSTSAIESEFKSEEEARQEIFRNLFDLVIKESLEAW
ncbi:MAG: hypothetical protein JW996_05155 [Candidatus Cloacimonetes bacterium]|nr:hypothetical protein [Candidatus Cloacimonadota bacterium]